MIDAQQDLIEGNNEEQGVFDKEKIINNINTVIEKAIIKSISIIFMRDLDVSKGEGPGFQLHKDIIVSLNATIFDKAATNSLFQAIRYTHNKIKKKCYKKYVVIN